MRNDFVILYYGREGSSPIIDGLSRHPDIYVPVFEHLDDFNYPTLSGDDDFPVHTVFDALFSRTQSDWLSSIVEGFVPGKFETAKSIGLKWRPWGDLQQISKVFGRNRVSLFILLRKHEWKRRMSIYFTNKVLSGQLGFEKDAAGNVHPQFILKELSEARYQEYIKMMGQLEFELEPEQLAEMIVDSINVKRRLLSEIKEIVHPKTRLTVVYYEDFVYRKREFFERFLSRISLPFSPQVLVSSFRKSTPDFETVVRDYDQLLASRPVRNAMQRWASLIATIERFAQEHQ